MNKAGRKAQIGIFDEDDPECRLDAVVTAYLEARERGEFPRIEDWISQHPDFAEDLVEFLGSLEKIDKALAPLRFFAAPSQSLGEYELLSELGRGGMGVVYKALDRKLNRLVALKMIRAGRHATPAEVQRFRNEAETAAHLEHPHIVPIHNVGDIHGQLYFTMKFIDGTNLACLCRQREVTVDLMRIASLMATVARTVQYAHEHGILHRDLKPSNILVDSSGQPHVADFGLARWLNAEQTLTDTGDIIGTPVYMAPEQLQGRRGVVTIATDVYGLGAILYTLLTRKPPFEGETSLETLTCVKECEPAAPRDVNKKVDRDLETICLKCLQKNPTARYASAQALAEDLERWLRGEPIHARPIGRLIRAWRWLKRNPILGIVMGMFFLAGAGAVLTSLLLWRSQTQTYKALQKAEDRTRWARSAVDDMYTQFAQEWLANAPLMTEVQLAFLRKALEFYAELSKEDSDDPSVQLETAKAYGRVGNIKAALEQNGEAVEAFRRSVTAFDGLRRELFLQEEVQLDLSRTLAGLGHTLCTGDRLIEAEEPIRRSLQILHDLELRNPSSSVCRLEVSDAQRNLASVLARIARPNEAEAAHRQALAIARELMVKYPDDLRFKRKYAVCLGGLGQFLASHRGQTSEPLELVQQAIAILEQSRDKSFQVEGGRDTLASYYRFIAGLLFEKGDVKKAKASVQRSRELLESLYAEYPVRHIESTLPRTWNMQATILAHSGEINEAIELYRRTMSMQQKLVEAVPNQPSWRYELAVTHSNLACLLATCPDSQARNASEALHLARRAVQLIPNQDEPWNTVNTSVVTLYYRPRDRKARVAAIWNTLGVACYRAGEWRESVRALERSMDLYKGGDSFDWFVLAMAHGKLGNMDLARTWYDKAVDWMDKYQTNNYELIRLRKETAETVVFLAR